MPSIATLARNMLASREAEASTPCPLAWCTRLHGWQDVDQRLHTGDTLNLAAFSVGEVEAGSSAKASLEQDESGRDARVFLQIDLEASYSREELLSFADELQALSTKLRAMSVAGGAS